MTNNGLATTGLTETGPEKTGFGKNLRLLTASDYKAVFSQAEFKVSCPQILILAIKHGRKSVV